MWLSKCKALFIDIHGVLFNSASNGDYRVIEGSIEAMQKLQKEQFPFLLVTNESQLPPQALLKTLNSIGFQLKLENIYSPVMAIKEIIVNSSLKPFCIMSDSLKNYFPHYDIDCCDSVVITDAHGNFTYQIMNKAFQYLMKHPESRFITAGKGKFYRDSNMELMLDLGPYAEALEFATEKKAEVIGKPGQLFFKSALKKLHSTSEDTIMIGDDITNDVGGAQSVDMFGVLVRSGKYRPEDENHPKIKPNLIVNCINDFVQKLFP